jgi:hypothetical protein
VRLGQPETVWLAQSIGARLQVHRRVQFGHGKPCSTVTARSVMRPNRAPATNLRLTHVVAPGTAIASRRPPSSCAFTCV